MPRSREEGKGEPLLEQLLAGLLLHREVMHGIDDGDVFHLGDHALGFTYRADG